MKNWIFEDSTTYDILKWLAAPVLPAVATFLVAVGEIWGQPMCSLIGATISALAVCLGAITQKSSKVYWAAQQSGGDMSPYPTAHEEYEEEEVDGGLSDSDDL